MQMERVHPPAIKKNTARWIEIKREPDANVQMEFEGTLFQSR